jgi:hypothetical protein
VISAEETLSVRATAGAAAPRRGAAVAGGFPARRPRDIEAAAGAPGEQGGAATPDATLPRRADR